MRKQIARKLRTQYVEALEGIYSNSVTLKSRLRVTQGYWKWHRSIDRIRVPISVPFHSNYGGTVSCIVCEIKRLIGRKSLIFYTAPV